MDQGSAAPTAGSPSALAGVMGSTPASGGGATAAADLSAQSGASSMTPQQRMAVAKLLQGIAQAPQPTQQAQTTRGLGAQYQGGPGMVNTSGGGR